MSFSTYDRHTYSPKVFVSIFGYYPIEDLSILIGPFDCDRFGILQSLAMVWSNRNAVNYIIRPI